MTGNKVTTSAAGGDGAEDEKKKPQAAPFLALFRFADTFDLCLVGFGLLMVRSARRRAAARGSTHCTARTAQPGAPSAPSAQRGARARGPEGAAAPSNLVTGCGCPPTSAART